MIATSVDDLASVSFFLATTKDSQWIKTLGSIPIPVGNIVRTGPV